MASTGNTVRPSSRESQPWTLGGAESQPKAGSLFPSLRGLLGMSMVMLIVATAACSDEPGGASGSGGATAASGGSFASGGSGGSSGGGGSTAVSGGGTAGGGSGGSSKNGGSATGGTTDSGGKTGNGTGGTAVSGGASGSGTGGGTGSGGGAMGGSTGTGAGGADAGVAGADGGTAGQGGGSGGRSGNGGAGGMSTGTGGVRSDGGPGGSSGAGGAGFQPCPAGAACAIMPVGDSITEGCCTAPMGGYRIELYRQTLTNKKNITFVGTLSNGPSTVDNQPFPKSHEGHGGWKISQIAGVIDSAISKSKPNIVLLKIGTNDINGNDNVADAPNRLDSLITQITKAAPSALLVVSSIIPTTSDSVDQKVQTYNAAIKVKAENAAAAGKHVVFVDNHAPFMQTANWKTALMADGLHPNTAGYVVLGQSFYKVISALLPAAP